MIIEKEELGLFNDTKVRKPLYAHQKFVLNYDNWDKLKIHVPTSGGKTLSAVLFALKEKYVFPSTSVRTILTYPTNLLSQNQFEASVIRGLHEWIGAKEIERGVLHPVKKRIVPGWNSFFGVYGGGAPTIVFELPPKLGRTKLWLTILNGEILFNMFDEENRLELGEKKGKYLLNVLDTLSQRDHILITSPDLLGYVAQQCYSISGGWYRQRWKDQLSLYFWEHKVVIDEYHFYDPYTYINLERTLEKLNIEKILLLSATKKKAYFEHAKILSTTELEEEFTKDQVGTHIASYPIEVNLMEGDMNPQEVPALETIYFFNSVIIAHEIAEQLRNRKIDVTEWTGIQKTSDKLNKLIIATSAAEVGLDLELYEMHTEFWGYDWEIPSLIQRIGRVGRFKSKYPFRGFIHIDHAKEAWVLKEKFDRYEILTKDQFTSLLYEAYGEQVFDPTSYVSYYLWDEEQKQKLKGIWGVIESKMSFYFRPPQSQAVFDWGGHKFVYNKAPIENRYHIELVRKITNCPFWKSFRLSEYKILDRKSKEERSWKKPYTGKLQPSHESKKWFISWNEDNNII